MDVGLSNKLKNEQFNLWAKSSTEAWHPLLCHMVDSALVAAQIWDQLPRSTKRWLAKDFEDPETCRFLFILSAAIHDLGKASPVFQSVVKARIEHLEGLGLIFPKTYPERDKAPHSIISAATLHDVLTEYNWCSEEIKPLASIIGGHHGRFPNNDYRSLCKRRPSLVGWSRDGCDPWMLLRASVFANILNVVGGLCGFEDAIEALGQLRERIGCLDGARLLALSGYVIVADWLASNQELFPLYSQSYDDQYMQRAKSQAEQALETIGWHQVEVKLSDNWFERQFGFQPNSLQREVCQVVKNLQGPALIIIEAPMGLGKTEAALSAAELLMVNQELGGVFVGLPTQATTNQMFKRTKHWLQKLGPGTYVLQLAHGKAQQLDEYKDIMVHHGPACVEQDVGGGSDATVVAEAWFSGPKKRLLAPFVVGTIDQALASVAKVKHVSLRKVGLSGKVVIFDEIHAYDAYMSVFIERVLQWLAAEDIPVILLSATLPPPLRSRLAKAYIGRDIEIEGVSYPAVTAIGRNGKLISNRGTIQTPQQSADLELLSVSDPTDPKLCVRIAEMAQAGANVLVILNTVARAQGLYRALCDRLSNEMVKLIHSRFCAGDRLAKETWLASHFGPKASRPEGHVVIGTQVLEQSLDIDFDVLVSDIAPVDLVLQRLGRVHRHPGKDRPTDFKRPRAMVIGWEGDPPEFPKDLCLVYGKHLLLRSLASLQGLTTITLPQDLPRLVDQVYDGDLNLPANWKPQMSLAQDAWETSERDRRSHAEQFTIRPPDEVSELFALCRNSIGDFEDEDPKVQAAIRDAQPTIEVAAGFLQPCGTIRFHEREVAIDREPSSEEIDGILSSLLRLPSYLTSAAAQLDVPASWQHHPWLRKHRVLLFGSDSTAQFEDGEFTLHYDTNVGLEVQRGRR